MRFFNTAGPMRLGEHYTVPLLARLDVEGLLQLIAQMKYFVLHAPRQMGKTSALFALRDKLNEEGRYRCVYLNVESAQAAREDVALAMRRMAFALADEARAQLGEERLSGWVREAAERADPLGILGRVLERWSQASDKPTVLLLDEVDALIGDTLISLLRQLRAGYPNRPERFPQSVVLCGVRDVRDYRIHSSATKEIITGGSAFNIKATSLRLWGFDRGQVEQLLRQHTEETGQPFENEAIAYVWEVTQGQPWLVNALAYAATFENKGGRDRGVTVTRAMMEQAKETLVRRRDTHLDQLVDKLQEPRVRRVVEPLLAGVDLQPQSDDIQYVVDLGLVEERNGRIEVANPIYREIIPRELTRHAQLNLAGVVQTAWFVRQDGRLDMPKLLAAFQQFFRENAEVWVERFDYKEAGPHLILQAFLQRVVNGGRIEREYALGTRRVDLLVHWPLDAQQGLAGATQRVALELKLLRKSLQATLDAGLAQTAAYAGTCGADEAHLIVFDRDPDKLWDDKVFTRQERYGERAVTVWGM